MSHRTRNLVCCVCGVGVCVDYYEMPVPSEDDMESFEFNAHALRSALQVEGFEPWVGYNACFDVVCRKCAALQSAKRSDEAARESPFLDAVDVAYQNLLDACKAVVENHCLHGVWAKEFVRHDKIDRPNRHYGKALLPLAYDSLMRGK